MIRFSPFTITNHTMVIIIKNITHPMNKIGIKAQKLFSDRSNKKTGEIYPDFIGKNPLNRIIADAKYKPAENVGNKDYLQVICREYTKKRKGIYRTVRMTFQASTRRSIFQAAFAGLVEGRQIAGRPVRDSVYL